MINFDKLLDSLSYKKGVSVKRQNVFQQTSFWQTAFGQYGFLEICKLHESCLPKNILHVDKMVTLVHTLSLKSLHRLSSVRYKTTQTTGGVGVAGACPPTSKLGTFLLWSLALIMPIYRNFQKNGALGETWKPPDPLFLKQNRGLGGFRVPPKAPFIWKLL